jgi:plastocyanin
VQPGDTIRFVNSSEITTMIESETAAWSVGPLIAAEEGTATVESAMELIFFATEVTGADEDEIDADDTTDDTNTVTVEGALSFEAPPA